MMEEKGLRTKQSGFSTKGFVSGVFFTLACAGVYNAVRDLRFEQLFMMAEVAGRRASEDLDFAWSTARKMSAELKVPCLVQEETVAQINPENEFQCINQKEHPFVYAPKKSLDHLWPFGARPTAAPDACTVDQIPPTSTQDDIVAVPISPFHACHNKVPRLTCHHTIILDSTEAVFPVPRVSGLKDSVCQDIISKNTKDVMVCMQTANTLDVLVHPTSNGPFRYVFPSEASEQMEEWKRRGFEARLVQRQVVAMNWVYDEREEKTDKFRAINSNLGNHMWMFGASRMVNPATTLLVKANKKTDLRELGQPTAYIFAMANHLDLWRDQEREKARKELLSPWTDVVKKQNVPTIVLGVGIQFPPSMGDPWKLKFFEYQKEFLNAIASRQNKPAIGTRGELTTKICENSNIPHCIPSGCPSLTISRSENLGQTLSRRWKTVEEKLEKGEKLRVAIAIPAHYNVEIFDFFWRVHRQHKVIFIPQEPADPERVFKYQKEQAKKGDAAPIIVPFNNTEEWIDYMEDDIDFVISPRIHGSMAAIGAGTPVAVIPIDARIKELVDAMRIPHVDKEQFLKQKPYLKGFVKMTKYTDFDAFEANRVEKLAIWKGVLAEANIEMDPKLLSIVNAHGKVVPTISSS